MRVVGDAVDAWSCCFPHVWKRTGIAPSLACPELVKAQVMDEPPIAEPPAPPVRVKEKKNDSIGVFVTESGRVQRDLVEL